MDNLVPNIVSMYRARQNMTQDELAQALTEEIVDQSLTGAAVSYWESGQRKPQAIFLIRLAMAYPETDWRNRLAFDLLAATVGGQYQPKGEIGRHVMLGEPLMTERAHPAIVMGGD